MVHESRTRCPKGSPFLWTEPAMMRQRTSFASASAFSTSTMKALVASLALSAALFASSGCARLQPLTLNDDQSVPCTALPSPRVPVDTATLAPVLAKIQPVVDNIRVKLGAPGAGVIVVQGGRVVSFTASGEADTGVSFVTSLAHSIDIMHSQLHDPRHTFRASHSNAARTFSECKNVRSHMQHMPLEHHELVA
jgi:hypothetical protein